VDDELAELIEAVRLSDGSDAVLKALIRAAREAADPAPVVTFLAEADPSRFKADETRYLAGALLIELGAPADALKWYLGASPKAKAGRARARLALGDRSTAASEYREAIAEDASLKSADLDLALTAVLAQGGRGAEVFDLKGRKIADGAELPGPAALPPAEREVMTFTDVAGHDEVKAQISRKIVLPFAKPSLFQRFKKKAGGGVLMYGPPGCGKTLLARATAGECNAKFLSVHIPEILDMYIGQSEKRLAAAFVEARQSRPSVLFIDEIEALAARRKYATESTQATLVSTFLSEMDGVSASNEGVLILAATNVPWAIDTAFRRPGRFDKVIFVPPPDEGARRAILRLKLADRPQAKDLAIDAIAAKTSGFSGADLEGLVETAVEIAIEESIKSDAVAPLTNAHLASALKEMKPSTLEWLSSARNYAKYANQGGLYDDVAEFLNKHAK
jgi:AAA+ superfamily predicted ATPase